MLIIVSNPTAVAGEANIINTLFDEGLEILHIRKPGIAANEMKALIEKIKRKYHRQIALHQHHNIAHDLGINRLHFIGEMRKEMSEEELNELKNGNILSTSIHRTEEYKYLSSCFDYAFFGPVFNSISKQGYASVISSDFIFPIETDHPKVIAIGGINATNISQAISIKFNGVAALGAIWQKPGESVEQFKLLQKAWKQAGQ